MKNCNPKTHIYFPVTGQCVPKMKSKPVSNTETTMISAGSVVLGALAGWLLSKSSSEDFEEELELHEMINDYHLTDFIPNIDEINFYDLSDSQTNLVNKYVAKGVLERLEQVDDVEAFESIFTDLQVLEQYIIEQSEYVDLTGDEKVQVDTLVANINNIQEILGFYEQLDDMVEAMQELSN